MSKSYLADLPQFGLEYGASSGCPPFTIVRHILKIVAHFWYRVPLFSYHTPTERTKHGCCTYYAKQLKKTTETAHNNDPVCVCVCFLMIRGVVFHFWCFISTAGCWWIIPSDVCLLKILKAMTWKSCEYTANMFATTCGSFFLRILYFTMNTDDWMTTFWRW